MKAEIERLKMTRNYVLDLIKDLSVDQLNEVPKGFNNNVIWNLGHLVVSQQGICYVRSGVKPVIDEKYFADYKPQTKPSNSIEPAEVETLKALFISAINRLESDFESNVFENENSYKAFTSPYGVVVNNIEDAIKFLLFHEGLHTGYIMAMKRVLK